MGDLQLGLRLTATADQSHVQTAKWADANGFHSVWVTDGWTFDPFVVLARVAERTDSIGIGTSVVNVIARSPASIAIAARSLQDAAPNRVSLGVGVSHPALVNDLHGRSYTRPLQELAASIDRIRALLEGAVEGYDLGTGDVESAPPIFNGALGPTNRRLTGRICDGWIPYHVPFSALEGAFEEVSAGARDIGRHPDEITTAPFVPVAVSPTGNEAEQVVRENIAVHLGEYRAFRDATAATYDVSDVVRRWQSGDNEGAMRTIPDEAVRDLAVFGTGEEVRRRVRDLCESADLDLPILVIPARASDELVERTLSAIRPAAF